jgi:Winged helix DNA-binding domain
MPLDLPVIRAWWSHRQGLDGSLASATPAEVLCRTGWARSVAGCGPYLTFFSRCGASRENVDAAVANVEIHELPAARGCTYIVPAPDYALALQVGQPFREAERKVGRTLGVTDAEIDKLCAAILKALAQHGALAQQHRAGMDPDEIRRSVGTVARSLGEAGKKKGITTTIPLALGALQTHGEIRRIPVNGRLDQQRYQYALWANNPLKGRKVNLEEAHPELASRYFRWITPATLAEFQWFSGLTAKAAKAAVAPLKLAALDDYLLFADDLEALRSFKIPKAPQYSLVSSLDAITALRRNVDSLADEGVLEKKGHVTGLANHCILDRGRLIGLWDYDTGAEEIVWKSFVPKTQALEKVVNRTAAYVRQELGDARSFSLDSPQSRVARLAALR